MSRRFTKIALAVATASAFAFSPDSALANGRFPGASQLVMRGNEAVIATSFGIVTSHDRFASAGWVCEESLGYDVTQNNDLAPGIFENGNLAVAGPLGVTISTDRGCTNVPANGPVARLWMSDVTIDEASPSSGLAISRGPLGSGECTGELFESRDSGATWAAIGAKFPKDFCTLTVDSAPSDPNRIYVSGNSVDANNKLIGQLLVSDDRGQTWRTYDIPGEGRPFIGPVHPTDRDTVFIRSSNPPDAGNLLVTRDGGKTYTKIATLTGILLQFFGVTGLALSPDGSKLAYGSINEGLFVMDAAGASPPEKRADFPITCLAWKADGIYACSTPNLCGPFFVGYSTDDGRRFDALTPTLDIHGERTTCASSSPVGSTCPSQWEAVRARLGVCGEDGKPIPPENKPDAGPPTPAPAPPDIDCFCRATAIPRGGSLALAVVGVVGVVAFVRRMSRRRDR